MVKVLLITLSLMSVSCTEVKKPDPLTLNLEAELREMNSSLDKINNTLKKNRAKLDCLKDKDNLAVAGGMNSLLYSICSEHFE